MISERVFGLALVFSAVVLITTLVLHSRLRRTIQRLVIVGLWIRIVGSLSYLYVMRSYYGGVADYNGYFRGGLQYADVLRSGNLSTIVEPWTQGRWWGTEFTVRLSGAVLSIIGPTLTGAFIVFAALGYIGVLAFATAFTRAFGHADKARYLRWIVLFPSLWFWPAALGKDAIVLCGIGLATLGFVGYRGRVRWLPMAVGVLLVFCIRPQVAAVLVLALVAGRWLGTARRMSSANAVSGLFLLAGGAAVIALAGDTLGVELFRVDEVQDYLEGRAQDSAVGGSALELGASSWFAPINVFFRPMPWEAKGLTVWLAAIEMVLLWVLVWHRRAHIMAFVRAYRRTPLFWMGTVFVLVYAITLGMSISNMGIIARQRVHILPFVFMLLAGVPRRWPPTPGAGALPNSAPAGRGAEGSCVAGVI